MNIVILLIQCGGNLLLSNISPPNSYTVINDQLFNTALKKVYFKIPHSGSGNGFGGGSYAKSDVICHKCGKKVHTQRNCRS